MQARLCGSDRVIVWWGSGLFDRVGVANAGLVKAGAGLDVLLWADFEVREFAALVLGMEVLEEWDAPLASCSSAQALGDKGGDGRILALEKAPHLSE